MFRQARKAPSILLVIGLMCCAPLFAAEAPAASPAVTIPVTFGQFTLMYARALRLALPPTATQEVALEALRAVRAPLPADLDLARTLTHGDIVLIGRAARLRLSTSTPQLAFSHLQTEQFLLDYAPAIRTSIPAFNRTAAALGSDGQGGNNQDGDHQGEDRPHQSESVP